MKDTTGSSSQTCRQAAARCWPLNNTSYVLLPEHCWLLKTGGREQKFCFQKGEKITMTHTACHYSDCMPVDCLTLGFSVQPLTSLLTLVSCLVVAGSPVWLLVPFASFRDADAFLPQPVLPLLHPLFVLILYLMIQAVVFVLFVVVMCVCVCLLLASCSIVFVYLCSLQHLTWHEDAHSGVQIIPGETTVMH